MLRALVAPLVVLCCAAAKRQALESAAQQLATQRHASSDPDFDSKCGAEGSTLWTDYARTHHLAVQAKEGSTDRVLVWTCSSTGCGGIGNQLRGIAVALLTAMVTNRSFYLQPENSAFGLASSPEHNQIDWRLPGGTSLDHCQSVTRMCARGDCDWAAVLEHEAPCLRLETNSVPSQWWNEVEQKSPELLKPLQRALGGTEFLSGCALRFLFDFSKMERELAQDAAAPSSKYVAIHMRMGDAYLHGNAKLVPADEARMRTALTCARELGRTLFAEGEDWGVFFASDSTDMKDLALSLGGELGIRVMQHSFTPVHTQCCDHMHSKLWGDFSNLVGYPELSVCHGYCQSAWHTWGDFLTILRAQGLVSAGSASGSAATDLSAALYTRGVSDYSQVPTNFAFMPFQNQRRVPPQTELHAEAATCARVTPDDTRVIL